MAIIKVEVWPWRCGYNKGGGVAIIKVEAWP